ncbi:hypothetical protein [Streptomyces sp. NPDC007346]|uniref:hypothetical protein n=1 Tax=Streptomyces sp. NPDC007346 TaxID=3154682 RepID=UPI0034527FFF
MTGLRRTTALLGPLAAPAAGPFAVPAAGPFAALATGPFVVLATGAFAVPAAGPVGEPGDGTGRIVMLAGAPAATWGLTSTARRTAFPETAATGGAGLSSPEGPG